MAEAGNEGVPQQLRNTGTPNYTTEDGDTEPAPRETSGGSGSYRGFVGLGTNSPETDHNYGTRYNLSIDDNVASITTVRSAVNRDESGVRYVTTLRPVDYVFDTKLIHGDSIKRNNLDLDRNDVHLKKYVWKDVKESITTSENKLKINHNFSKPLLNLNFSKYNPRAEPRLTTYNIDTTKTSINPTVRESESSAEKVASSVHTGTRVAKSAYPYGSTSHYRTFDRGYNSPEQTPPDPFVALFLSHYGKYLPAGGGSLGDHYNNLYSYLASNNLHNNKPFGSYKIYEDTDG